MEIANRHECPCCGFGTLRERGRHEVCVVCWWEDDGRDEDQAHLVRGDPALSLDQARANFRQYGVSDPEFTRMRAAPDSG